MKRITFLLLYLYFIFLFVRAVQVYNIPMIVLHFILLVVASAIVVAENKKVKKGSAPNRK